MTPELQMRWDALDADRQDQLLPMIEDLITTVENEGAALVLADPRGDGVAAMLSVGDVDFVQQLLASGAKAYGELFKRPLEGVVLQ